MQPGAGRPFQRSRLRYDAAFALETAYAYEHAIPWSEYLERWEAEDRAIVTAVSLERSERCVSCGTADWEWEVDPNAYEPVVHYCRGCALRETLQKDNDTPKGPGHSVRLVSRRAAEALRTRMERRKAEGSLRPRLRRE